MTTAVVLFNKMGARNITNRIRKAGENLAALLLEAHDGEAWKALGYKSWAAYIEGEFEFTRQHSYRLLTQERINRQLEAAGSSLRVTEREARDLSPTGDTREIEHEVIERREAPIVRVRNGGDSFPSDAYDAGEAVYRCRHCQRVGTVEALSRCLEVVRGEQDDWGAA